MSNFRCGFVTLIGRPNVGKSTILNQMLGEKLAAVSPKAQTTRKRLRGILTDSEVQIIFVDTPGVHKASEGMHLNEFFVSEALDSLADADAYVYVIDGSRPFQPNKEGSDESFLLEQLKARLAEKKKPLFVLLNKMDLWEKGELKFSGQKELQAALEGLPVEGIFPISAKKQLGLETFLEAIKQVLPEGPALYPEDEITDQNTRSIVAELIQETLFYTLGEEIPYSCAVEVESYKDPSEKQKYPEIHASIHVERESQKPVLIGRGGAKIKEIGQKSRENIERLLGTKVVLKLFVKVTPKWTKNPEQLKQLGYALPEGKK